MTQLRPPKLEDMAPCPRCEGKITTYTYFNPTVQMGYRCKKCHTSWEKWWTLRLELIDKHNSSTQSKIKENK